MGMDKLWESKQKLNKINQPQLLPNNEAPARGRFEDRHKRITIYLEREIYEQLQVMRSRGYSQTKVINNALKLCWDKMREINQRK